MSTLKINDYETSLINEISAISSFKPLTIRNILESTFLRQLESLLSGEEIHVPFLGVLQVKYEGDDYVSGSRLAKLNVEFLPSELLKRLAGEIHDGESDIIWQLSERKIRSAAQRKLEE